MAKRAGIGKRGSIRRSDFGRLLQEYRRHSKDPDSQDALTQAKLAVLLEEKAGLDGYSYVDVSRWEKGGKDGKIIPADDRKLLMGLISVLHLCGGILSREEANALLRAGYYQELDEDEIYQVNMSWLVSRGTTTPQEKVEDTIHCQKHTFTNYPTAIPSPGTPFKATSAPFMVPPLPPQGVFGRDDLLTTIFDQLRLGETQAANVPPLALRGMGGIGKTTLTIAFGRLDRMRQRFPDGILWIVLGPNPTVRLLLENWGRALGLDLLPERDEDACRDRLQEALYPRQALLIVDDVWEIKHGKQFMVAGPHCRTLLTTRESLAANHLATSERTLKVDLLSPEASLQLLQRLAPVAVAMNQPVARRLCERLEYLPLALTLAGRLLANEAEVPGRMQRLADELLERRDARLHLLQAEGRLGIDEENPVSLQAILGLSVDRLDKTDRQRFAMASVFGGEPLTWDINLAAHVWECTVPLAEDTVARFSQRGLVERRGDGRYWMHALLADYAKALMDTMGL